MVGLEFGGILLPQSAWWWGDRCTCNVDHGTKGSCVLGRSYQLMSIHSQLRDLEKHSSLGFLPTLQWRKCKCCSSEGKGIPPTEVYLLCLGRGRGVEVVPQSVSAVLQKILAIGSQEIEQSHSTQQT
jgi:hypothetical protein